MDRPVWMDLKVGTVSEGGNCLKAGENANIFIKKDTK